MIREIQEDGMNRERKFKIQVYVSLGASVTDISNHNRAVESGEERAGGRGGGGKGVLGRLQPPEIFKDKKFFLQRKIVILYDMISRSGKALTNHFE